MTATGGHGATGSFSLSVTGTCVCLVLYYSSNGAGTSLVLHTHSGGRVVHSYGRLIPRHFPITHLHQISHLRLTGELIDSIITCVSSGTPPPRFYSPNGTLDTGGVTQRNYSAHSAILAIQQQSVFIHTTTTDNPYNTYVFVQCRTLSSAQLYKSTDEGKNGQVHCLVMPSIATATICIHTH